MDVLVVPVEGDSVTVDYGEWGGVIACNLTQSHALRIIQDDLPAPPPPPTEVEACALANLEMQRQGWVCDPWQIKTVLDRDLFGAAMALPA